MPSWLYVDKMQPSRSVIFNANLAEYVNKRQLKSLALKISSACIFSYVCVYMGEQLGRGWRRNFGDRKGCRHDFGDREGWRRDFLCRILSVNLT